MIGTFNEEVLVDNLVALCLGTKTLKEAKKDFKKNCGLTKEEHSTLITTELTNAETDYLLGEFAIASYNYPELLEMYIRSKSKRWLDEFCYCGTIYSLFECASAFKSSDDYTLEMYAKIQELQEKIKRLEMRDALVHERAGLSCVKQPDPPPVKKVRPKSFIYFVLAGDLCKIGYTRDLETRLSQLQTGSPVKLQLAHVYQVENIAATTLEKRVHDHFKYNRLHGEWFCLDIDVDYFEEVCCSLGN